MRTRQHYTCLRSEPKLLHTSETGARGSGSVCLASPVKYNNTTCPFAHDQMR